MLYAMYAMYAVYPIFPNFLFFNMEYICMSTFNVRGCRDPTKRARIRDLFKSHKSSLVCLQETHCKDEEEAKIWANEWIRGDPYVWKNSSIDSVANNFTTRSRGTMVVADNSKIEILDHKCLFEGRVIFTLFTIKEFGIDKTILVNVYAPNGKRERAVFFKNLLDEINAWRVTHDCDQLMVTGDFNCILKPEDKSKECRVDRDESSKQLQELICQLNLTDVWRKLNKNKKQYTWRQVDTVNETRNVAVRLDRWYISPSLMGNVEKCYIVPNTAISDHLPVMLKLCNLNKVKRGKGVWKLNNSLLKCNEFCNEVSRFWEGWQILKPAGTPLLEWWDEGKIKIKEIAIKISKQQAKIRKQLETIIRDEYQEAVKHFDEDPNLTNAGILKRANNNLNRWEKQNINGVKVRARVQWCEQGEKSHGFFLNLEKYRGKMKTFTKIKKEDGTMTEDIQEILRTQKEFYEQLYSNENTDSEVQDYFLNSLDATLTDQKRDSCEGLITHEEATKAMKEMANNKSPGCDGLSKEFYAKFWNLMGKDLVEIFNVAYGETSLAGSQRLAIITLLYKNGEKADIKNWRPISLLNVDFKILSKCLANRLKKCMDSIVHQDQTCGIKGRSIFENIIFTQDAVFYVNKHKKPLAVISVDQSKAFDRLNRTYLLKVLKKFGFGDSFIHWIQTLYSDTFSQICTNGYLSDTFKLERGVRQGCPLSPMLFTLATETLLCAIRKKEDIKGFLGPENQEIKTKGYADDTTVYVRDIDSVHNTMALMEKYGRASESKLNRDKTKILLCGTLRDHIPVQTNFDYVIDKMKLLGVWIGNCDTTNENWQPVANKVSKVLGLWSYRDLTVRGKAIVVNVMALSKVWYLATVSTPPDNIITQIESAIIDFVWAKGLQLIKRDLLHAPEEYGGVNCFDVKQKSKSLKIKWLKKILENDTPSALSVGAYFLENFDNSFKGKNVITTNLKNVKNDKIPLFYQDIVNTWQQLHFKRLIPGERGLLLEEFLFSNPLFIKNGESLYFFNWIQKGIMKIKHIWDRGRESFMTFGELVNQYHMAHSFKHEDEYRKLLEALPPIFVSNINNGDENIRNVNDRAFPLTELYDIKDKELLPKSVYHRLMYIKTRGFETCFAILDKANLARINMEQDRKRLSLWWLYLKNADLDHKTKQFQWKLSHNGLYTGVLLHQIDPEIAETCTFCNNEQETLIHIFLKCNIVIIFWEWIFQSFNFRTTLQEAFMYVNNHEELTKIQSLVTFIAKSTIWEMVGIQRKSLIQHILPSLKLNFKYKLQSHLNILYLRYKYRQDCTFENEYLLQPNVITKEGNDIKVKLNML